MGRVNKIPEPTCKVEIVSSNSMFKITNLHHPEIIQNSIASFLESQRFSYVIRDEQTFLIAKISHKVIEKLEKEFFDWSINKHLPSWITIRFSYN